MFYSEFGKKLLNYLRAPKKYLVNVQVKVGNRYVFIDIEAVSFYRREAILEAEQIAKSKIEIKTIGSKSLGRIKDFNSF